MPRVSKEELGNLKTSVIIGFETGANLKTLAEKFGVRQATILSIISEYDKLKVPRVTLKVNVGHKDEAYCTEQEMVEGFPKYHKKDLKGLEEIIFNTIDLCQ